MKEKGIGKTMWGVFWKLHDGRRKLSSRVKERLDWLPPQTRKRMVLVMLALFALLAVYTFGKAVYDIGKDRGRQIELEHIKHLELPEQIKNLVTPYADGTEDGD